MALYCRLQATAMSCNSPQLVTFRKAIGLLTGEAFMVITIETSYTLLWNMYIDRSPGVCLSPFLFVDVVVYLSCIQPRTQLDRLRF